VDRIADLLQTHGVVSERFRLGLHSGDYGCAVCVFVAE
jgi:hypothetical protein